MTAVLDRRPGVDSGYAWRLAFLSAFCIGLGGGSIYLPVVALKEIAVEFGDRRTVPSLAYMLGFLSMGLGGVLMGWGAMIAHGRIIPLERQSDATRMPAGNCYTFQPDRRTAARRIGEIRDFSRGSAQPLEPRQAAS